jgi:uncharacterized protein (TIGR02147 family)
MKDTIFEHDHYRTFLRMQIQRAPRAGHGYRQLMATSAGIQPTYLSQVLKGDRNLSADQAVLVAEFLNLSKDEAEFFLLLVQRARAATPKSVQFFDRLLDERRDAFSRVKERMKISGELSEEDKAVYYSDVAYGAVHMAVTIPEFRSISALAQRLNLSQERTREVAEFLISKGLVERAAGELQPGRTQLFVDRSSPHVVAHHRNWRLKALEKPGARNPNDYHVSFGFSVSEKDAKLLRQKLAKVIEEMSEQIKASPEEKLMGFCLDFFEY